MELNKRIKLLEAEAEAIQYDLAKGSLHYIKNIKTKEYIKKHLFIVIANSHKEVEEIDSGLRRALGNPGRGNSRIINYSFYKDLIVLFYRMKKAGINLPRWNISKKHLRFDLYNVLKAYGYITNDVSEDLFNKNTEIRNTIHHKVERIFVRIANAIEKKPPQK